MRQLKIIVSVLALCLCTTTQAQNSVMQVDTTIVPGVEYLLRNVSSGLFITRSGTLVTDPIQADSWRFLSDESPTMLHSNQIFLFMANGGVTGWRVNLTGEAKTQEIIKSNDTQGAFKFRCKYMLDTRYLNVQADSTLGFARTQDTTSDWQLVRAPEQNAHLYRLLTVETKSGSTQFTIGYQSVDVQGNPVELSGFIVLPTSGKGGMCTADHILFSTHYTMAKNAQVPSMADPYDALTFTFSSNKPVMIEPDYMGYGISFGHPHPYIEPNIMARNCVDMLLATHQLLREMCGFDVSQGNIPTYGIGYSQGGSTILAVQKYIETSENISDSLRQVIKYTRTCAAAGPYNPLATYSQYLYQDDISTVSAVPLLISGMIDAFPEIFDTIRAEDYFSEAFNQADILGLMRSGNYNTDEIDLFIKSACGAKKVSLMLCEEAQDVNSDLSQKLMKALGQCNLTRDWVPQAEIRFYHNTRDDVVPYLNTISAYNAFSNNGVSNVTLHTSTIASGHVPAAIEFMARMILGNYK